MSNAAVIIKDTKATLQNTCIGHLDDNAMFWYKFGVRQACDCIALDLSTDGKEWTIESAKEFLAQAGYDYQR